MILPWNERRLASSVMRIDIITGQPLWCHWCNRDLAAGERVMCMVERRRKGRRRRTTTYRDC